VLGRGREGGKEREKREKGRERGERGEGEGG